MTSVIRGTELNSEQTEELTANPNYDKVKVD